MHDFEEHKKMIKHLCSVSTRVPPMQVCALYQGDRGPNRDRDLNSVSQERSLGQALPHLGLAWAARPSQPRLMHLLQA